MTLPSREARDRVARLAEEPLSRAEADAYLATPMSEAERQEVLELAAWFMRRYPSAAERLAYGRRAYRRAMVLKSTP